MERTYSIEQFREFLIDHLFDTGSDMLSKLTEEAIDKANNVQPREEHKWSEDETDEEAAEYEKKMKALDEFVSGPDDDEWP